MDADVLEMARELDSRIIDRIQIRLLWFESDDRVVVSVADGKTGEHFVVDVREPDRALHVFQHPYAYAAWHEPVVSGVALAV